MRGFKTRRMVGMYVALFFTVALLATTAYFIMGGLPLLLLQHDSPLDGRFIRRFFEVYYTAAFISAAGAAAGYAAWGKGLFALGSASIAVGVGVFRRFIIPTMIDLGVRIQDSDPQAIATFRKVHTAALLFNLVQLIVLVWGVIQISI